MPGLPEPYLVGLAVAGLAGLGVTLLPRLLAGRLLTAPLVLLVLGMAVFALPLGLDAPRPLTRHALVAERVTELAVIVALMACGLKLDRPFSWAAWRSTWLLLGVAMPLTIAAAALLGWWAGLPVAAAVLFGAVMAPTDPVLAADVQVGPPRQDRTGLGKEDEVRFSLTAEAGLNDGLAFPFVNAAILMVVAGAAPSGWALRWVAVDVVYRIVVGVLGGAVVGRLTAWLLFRAAPGRRPQPMEGPAALAATLLAYAAAEVAGGYGFLAVFVAGLVVRRSEGDHELHGRLHHFAEAAEQLLMGAVLVGLGGAVVGGALDALDWRLALAGLALIFLVRPAAGMLALWRARAVSRPHKWGISAFGIRGIGSVYYLTHALNEAAFPQGERVWAAVAFTILVSMVVHGFAARPFMRRMEKSAAARAGRRGGRVPAAP